MWALPVAGGRDDFPRLVAQLAVLVEPDGMLGAGYMAAIKPFRNLIVYPRMMQDMAGGGGTAPVPSWRMPPAANTGGRGADS